MPEGVDAPLTAVDRRAFRFMVVSSIRGGKRPVPARQPLPNTTVCASRVHTEARTRQKDRVRSTLIRRAASTTVLPSTSTLPLHLHHMQVGRCHQGKKSPGYSGVLRGPRGRACKGYPLWGPFSIAPVASASGRCGAAGSQSAEYVSRPLVRCPF